MSSVLRNQLQILTQPEFKHLLQDINRGIEKESLRITPQGKLAQTPHPQSLGSALTHSSITTDYSEALMEFITPVDSGVETSLKTLADIHSYVYQKLDDEILWSASMPCIVSGDDSIPVANYGSSNVARMKTVYRYGLGHRYGRLMQAISGIHYNFSMPQAYWEHSWHEAGAKGELRDYISERYLGLIRNFRRYSWLLIYLFGASPAVCSSFLRGSDDHNLQPFDDTGYSLHLPYGTSLRMGDLGYNSDAQKNLQVCYNGLDTYVTTLHNAISQPHPEYQQFSCGQDGDYQQLNASLLQIENEFYSPIRPKRVARSGETPLNALRRGGIEYIEVRCVDVSPFNPMGLDAEQIRFMDTFLLYCLLQDSPECTESEQTQQSSNMAAVVNRGREPGLTLQNDTGELPLKAWADDLLTQMKDIATALDDVHTTSAYCEALQNQRAKVADPELTPSARVLREMRETKLPFFKLAMQYSERWSEHFKQRVLDPAVVQRLADETASSFAAQHDIEAADTVSFEEYLADFYAQYDEL